MTARACRGRHAETKAMLRSAAALGSNGVTGSYHDGSLFGLGMRPRKHLTSLRTNLRSQGVYTAETFARGMQKGL